MDGNRNAPEEEDFSTQEVLILEQLEKEEASARTLDDWVALGLNAFLVGAYAQAIGYFDQACEIEPENAKVYLHRAETYRECGEYDEALNDYELAHFYGNKHASLLRDELKEELKSLKK
ncbi:MAG: tetratricopeptide repeat protein [Spirochaetia bacterium]